MVCMSVFLTMNANKTIRKLNEIKKVVDSDVLNWEQNLKKLIQRLSSKAGQSL